MRAKVLMWTATITIAMHLGGFFYTELERPGVLLSRPVFVLPGGADRLEPPGGPGLTDQAGRVVEPLSWERQAGRSASSTPADAGRSVR